MWTQLSTAKKAHPQIWPMSVMARRSPISATAELLFGIRTQDYSAAAVAEEPSVEVNSPESLKADDLLSSVSAVSSHDDVVSVLDNLVTAVTAAVQRSQWSVLLLLLLLSSSSSSSSSLFGPTSTKPQA